MSGLTSKAKLQRLRDKAAGGIFVSPVLLMLAALVVYPFLYGIYVSFFNTNLINRWDFVGFGNYTAAFADPELWKSLTVTLIFTVTVVLGHFTLGFIFALMLNREIKGRTIFRAILLLPWLFPDVVIANLWKWIFNANSGIINSILLSLNIIQEPVSWLGSPVYALPIVIIVCIWKGYPMIMIQLLAGLQTVSKDTCEAAQIDGANGWQTFTKIILPGMRATMVITLILDTVWWFKHVTIIWLLTQGGPGTATNTISVDIYKRAFEYFNFGSSSAIAVYVFLICFAISVGYRRLLKND